MLMSNPEIFSVPPESKNSSMFLSLRKFGFWNIPGIFLYLSFFPFSKSLPGKIFIFSTFGLRFRRFLFLNLSKFTLYVTISVSPAYPTLWNYKNTLILPVNYNSAVRTLFRTILSPKFMPPQILSTETLSNQLPLSINRPFRPPPLSHPHPPLPARFGEHFATQVPCFFIRLAGCWSDRWSASKPAGKHSHPVPRNIQELISWPEPVLLDHWMVLLMYLLAYVLACFVPRSHRSATWWSKELFPQMVPQAEAWCVRAREACVSSPRLFANKAMASPLDPFDA